MIQFVYSITIQKEGDFLSFLKSFDKKIMINDKVIDKNNKSGVIHGENSVETIVFIEKLSADDFKSMRELWKKITVERELSLEYVRDGWVWLLPFRQLHSGPDRPYNQIIKHNGLPTTRTIKKKDSPDLRLRRAEARDYGSIEEGEDPAHTPLDIIDILLKPIWLDRWHHRFRKLIHRYQDCRCGWIDLDLARDLFLQSFVLTVADIHREYKDAEPEVFYFQALYSMMRGSCPAPYFKFLNEFKQGEITDEQYEVYVKPTLEGLAEQLPRDYFYSREKGAELLNIYLAVIGTYALRYGTP